MPVTRLVLSSSIQCRAPYERVRQVFEHATDWAQWCGVVHEMRHAPCAWQPGARLHYVLRTFVGLPVAFDVTLTRVDRSVIEWTSVRGPIRGTRTWSFEENGQGVQVRDTKTFESTWLPVALVYPRFAVRHMSERWLADLARTCAHPEPERTS